MFYKNFINHCKKLLHLLHLKSISEKCSLQIANKEHALYAYWLVLESILWDYNQA